MYYVSLRPHAQYENNIRYRHSLHRTHELFLAFCSLYTHLLRVPMRVLYTLSKLIDIIILCDCVYVYNVCFMRSRSLSAMYAPPHRTIHGIVTLFAPRRL